MSERPKEHAWKACKRESVSGVRIPSPPSFSLDFFPNRNKKVLICSTFDSPLGQLLIVADEEGVHKLQFLDKKCSPTISFGTNNTINQLKEELTLYFSSKLFTFQTKVHLKGTPFQIQVLKSLQNIPFGKTLSYLEQAESIGRKEAVRAVANANGKNLLAIIIPCHRVIHSKGGIGGYSSGIERKKWLLEHEKKL